MLDGADNKKLKSLKTSKVGLEKASSTQYLKRGQHEKALFTENARRDWYKKARLTQMLGGAGYIGFFNENGKRGWYKKSFFTQYVRPGRHKKFFFAENDSQDMYVGVFFNLICQAGLAQK